ncbi:MAG: hypothetical protein B7Z81_08300, partial [Acidocella sp. 20-61-6]
MRHEGKRGRLVRMAGFRLSVLGTLLFTIGTIVVFAVIYRTTAETAHRMLAPIIASTRADVLSDALEDHLTLAGEIQQTDRLTKHSFYALTNAQGRQLAGNLVMPRDPLGWHSLTRFNEPGLPPGVLSVDGIGYPLADG